MIYPRRSCNWVISSRPDGGLCPATSCPHNNATWRVPINVLCCLELQRPSPLAVRQRTALGVASPGQFLAAARAAGVRKLHNMRLINHEKEIMMCAGGCTHSRESHLGWLQPGPAVPRSLATPTAHPRTPHTHTHHNDVHLLHAQQELTHASHKLQRVRNNPKNVKRNVKPKCDALGGS
jgi:hypothetical protein